MNIDQFNKIVPGQILYGITLDDHEHPVWEVKAVYKSESYTLKPIIQTVTADGQTNVFWMEELFTKPTEARYRYRLEANKRIEYLNKSIRASKEQIEIFDKTALKLMSEIGNLSKLPASYRIVGNSDTKDDSRETWADDEGNNNE